MEPLGDHKAGKEINRHTALVCTCSFMALAEPPEEFQWARKFLMSLGQPGVARLVSQWLEDVSQRLTNANVMETMLPRAQGPDACGLSRPPA